MYERVCDCVHARVRACVCRHACMRGHAHKHKHTVYVYVHVYLSIHPSIYNTHSSLSMYISQTRTPLLLSIYHKHAYITRTPLFPCIYHKHARTQTHAIDVPTGVALSLKSMTTPAACKSPCNCREGLASRSSPRSCVFAYVRIYVCMCVCACACVWVWVCLCACVYIYVYICVCVCVCMYEAY